LLLVPLVYVVLAALDVQRTVFGATQAAREAGRVMAVSGDEFAARYAAGLALRDQGIEPNRVDVRLTCTPGCTTPSGRITVDVATRVSLPYLPDVLSGVAAIPVSATHVAPVDRYRA
jgi:hypothetical protein